ncbi:MAG: methyltransferase domain-containing protein [Actinobacteria bacterium]|nr:methyltransferase domain-containing protein [Actinomycetota bacterium]
MEAVSWIGDVAGDMLVLEVACGAGHVAEAIAPHVRVVVGVDLTPELLDAGAQRLRDCGLRNVVLQQGNAASLPFVDASFDVVCCRSSLHHFHDRDRAVHEMVRTCRSGGRIAVNDLVAPSESTRHAFDDLHRMIDPSHVGCLLADDLTQIWPGHVTASLIDLSVHRFPITVAFSDVSQTRSVLDRLEDEIAGGTPTGFEPERHGDDIVVSFPVATVHATLP